LDAGAGSGALLRHLPLGHRLGVDIAPASAEVVQENFLETTPDWLQGQVKALNMQNKSTLCVVSNPPFVIVQFIDHSR